MYLLYEQEATTNTAKTVSDLAPPAKATGVEIQADTQNCRYTMDNTTAPVTGSVGMIFRTTDPPKQFLIDDLRRIKFIRDAGSNGNLNFHYFAGRDI